MLRGTASVLATTPAPSSVGGLKRTSLVHVPKSYDATKPVSIVLAYHGGSSNAEQMVHFCGLNDKADQAGFLVVYPNGTGRRATALTWNGGNCCGYAIQNKVDDVTFTKALLEDLAKVVKVDPKRVYATGMSNGAVMVYRLGDAVVDHLHRNVDSRLAGEEDDPAPILLKHLRQVEPA